MGNNNYEVTGIDKEELAKQIDTEAQELKQKIIDTDKYVSLEVYVADNGDLQPFANFTGKDVTLMEMAQAVIIAESMLDDLKRQVPELPSAIEEFKNTVKLDSRDVNIIKKKKME